MKFFKKITDALKAQKSRSLQQSTNDQSDWLTFKRFKGDNFWLVAVNRGLFNNNQIVAMSWLAIEYRFLQRQLVNGQMPKTDLANLYYAFEDELERDIAAMHGQIAASQTGFGSRIVWLCAPSTRLEEVVRSRASQFSSFPVDVSQASFKQFESLFPSHLEQQFAGNAQILAQLQQNGDDGSMNRQIMHWIHGNDTSNLHKIANALEAEGYRLEEISEDRIRFSRMTALSEKQTNEETTKLTMLCEHHGCEYDGWGSPVVAATIH